jgi:hypothetical protein
VLKDKVSGARKNAQRHRAFFGVLRTVSWKFNRFIAYHDKEDTGVFVRFRAPQHRINALD